MSNRRAFEEASTVRFDAKTTMLGLGPAAGEQGAIRAERRSAGGWVIRPVDAADLEWDAYEEDTLIYRAPPVDPFAACGGPALARGRRWTLVLFGAFFVFLGVLLARFSIGPAALGQACWIESPPSGGPCG